MITALRLQLIERLVVNRKLNEQENVQEVSQMNWVFTAQPYAPYFLVGNNIDK